MVCRYAVGRLAQATDEDLQLYLMQLVQVEGWGIWSNQMPEQVKHIYGRQYADDSLKEN